MHKVTAGNVERRKLGMAPAKAAMSQTWEE